MGARHISTQQEGTHETRYIAGDLYREAEALRKAGRLQEAEEKYIESINSGEAMEGWRKHGPAPAMYEALAKLYYNSGRDKQALEVLDRYLAFADKVDHVRPEIEALRQPLKPEIETLRERMARGTFRRVKQKIIEPEPTSSVPSQHKESERKHVSIDTEKREYYVYVHKDPQGNIFYVGKGTKNRAWNTAGRHIVWKHYVEKLGGVFDVEIIEDGLNDEEALILESRLIAHHGVQLVNWDNPQRSTFDLEEWKVITELRNENKRLLAQARLAEETDLSTAISIYRQALENLFAYESMNMEHGLATEIMQELSNGNIDILNRLTLCLKRVGREEDIAVEVNKYVERFPTAVEHTTMKNILKRGGIDSI